MFHVGRTGSTVLGLMLNDTRGVHWDGEVYHELLDGGPRPASLDRKAAIAHLRTRMVQAGRDIYGMELKFHHVRRTGIGIPDFVRLLAELGFTHFIVLRRRNALRSMVSAAVAVGDGPWHHDRVREPVVTRVTIPIETVNRLGEPRSLLDRLRRRDEQFRALDAALEAREVLRLTYEEDIASDPFVGYRRVCSYLGVPPQPVAVRLGKTNPFPLRDIVVNFDDVATALRGTEYAWMVEEEPPALEE